MLYLCLSAIALATLSLAGQTSGTRVAFTASYLESESTSSSVPIRFTRVQTNQGNAYNPANGKFTAPVGGLYQFSVVLSRESTNFGNVHAYLLVNGQSTLTIFSNMQGAYPIMQTGVYYLHPGDVVEVEGFPKYFSGGTYSSFSGFYIGN